MKRGTAGETAPFRNGASSMSVRAKFKVIEHRKHAGYNQEQTTVILAPEYDTTTPEDQRFAKATPSGRIEMWVDNPSAVAALPLGSYHYVDFTVVPAAVAAGA